MGICGESFPLGPEVLKGKRGYIDECLNNLQERILSSYHVKSLHMTGFVSSKEGFEAWRGKTKSRWKYTSA
jgi:hypothetical protein